MNLSTMRSFIRQIAPELADIDLRIECVASRVGGLYVAPEISESGRPMIIVNSGRGATESEMLAVLTHELAHAACDTPLDPGHAEIDIGLRREVVRRAIIGQLPTPKMPYEGHEDDFIRALVHLWARSDALGYRLMATDLFPYARYELSDLFAYLRALGDEPQRMMKLTLREVLKIDPPHDFSELWCSDVAAVESQIQENRTMSVTDLFKTLRRRETSKAATFHEVAQDIAAGKSVKPEVIEQAMADAGMNLDQLTALVAKYESRHKMRVRIAEADRLKKELADLDKKLAAARAKLDQAEKEFDDTRGPLTARIREIERVMGEADQFRSELSVGSRHPDPSVQARYDAATELRSRLHDRQVELQKIIGDNRRWVEYLVGKVQDERSHRIGKAGLYSTIATAQGAMIEEFRDEAKLERAETYKGRVIRDEAELADVSKQLETAERELAKIAAEVSAS